MSIRAKINLGSEYRQKPSLWNNMLEVINQREMSVSIVSK